MVGLWLIMCGFENLLDERGEGVVVLDDAQARRPKLVEVKRKGREGRILRLCA